jgi:calcium/calmodulin-dependent protein kinase I
MHGLYESKEAVYIVTELAKGNYTEKDASAMVKQVLEGVEYLHNLDVSMSKCHSHFFALQHG